MSNSLRLSDLLARSVTVEWYEAVALVRDVTERLLERSGATIVPELHQIEIADDGRVEVTGGSRSDEPVRRLGQLLQAAIVQSEPPVQLRLLMAQATAATPAFGSIREYTDALGYFERPDRAGALRLLYARAAAVPVPAIPQMTPTLDAIAPLRAPEPWDNPAKKSTRTSSRRGLWLTVCVALLLAAGTIGYLRFGRDSSKAPDVSTIALEASDAIGSAVVSGISSVTDRAGLGRLAPKDAPGTAPPVPAAPVEAPVAAPLDRKAAISPKPATSPKPVSVPKPQIVRVVAFDVDPSPIGEENAPVAAPIPIPAPLAGAADGPEKTAQGGGRTPQGDVNIYNAGSQGVTAPIAVRPQLPRDLPANVDKSRLGRIELTILPDGTVGAVKLLGLPNNVHEAMFLSAVKAWEFKPAMKDGRPVSYRKIIWMAFQ